MDNLFLGIAVSFHGVKKTHDTDGLWSASLVVPRHSGRVASLPWNRWQLCRGIGGNFHVESVATFARNTQRAIEQLPHVSVLSLDTVKQAESWHVRAEIVGPRVPAPAQISRVQQMLQDVMGQPVEVVVWARTDVVVTDEHYLSREAYTEAEMRQEQPAK